jgi:hypothetical protein
MFVTEQPQFSLPKKEPSRPSANIDRLSPTSSIPIESPNTETVQREGHSISSSIASRSIEYGEFHKVAAELLGE